MIIGKQGEQPFKISDNYVSRRHCEITQTATGNVFHIKDLGSSNGTYVNGFRVVECDVTLNDQILLGNSYALDLSKVFLKKDVAPEPNPNPHPQPETNAVFPERLRIIYNTYSDEKRSIANSQRWSMNLRMTFTQIVSIGSSLIVGGTSWVSALIGVVIGLIIAAVINSFSDKSSKKMETLTNTFQQQYADGNCNKFLGNYSPDYIENNLKCMCPNCKKPIK